MEQYNQNEDIPFNKLILIDFGLAEPYLDEQGKHVEEGRTNKATGTLKFSSVNSLNGV